MEQSLSLVSAESQKRVLYVDSVDDLRDVLINADTPTTAITKGYYSPNDGGGFEYNYDTLMSQADDGFFYIRSSGMIQGGWSPNIKDEVNIKIAGAVADGSTDNLNSFNTLDNHVENIYMPKGIYAVSGFLSLTNISNIRAEKGVKIIYTGSEVEYFIKLPVKSIVIDGNGLVVDGNDKASKGLYMVSDQNIDVTVDHITIQNCAQTENKGLSSGIILQGDYNTIDIRNTEIHNITSSVTSGGASRGIYISDRDTDQISQVRISNCLIDTVTVSGSASNDADGIYVQMADTYNNDTLIEGCSFSNCGKGSIKTQCRQVTITNNFFNGALEEAMHEIRIQRGRGLVSNNQLVYNTLYPPNTVFEVLIPDNGKISPVEISNNMLVNYKTANINKFCIVGGGSTNVSSKNAYYLHHNVLMSSFKSMFYFYGKGNTNNTYRNIDNFNFSNNIIKNITDELFLLGRGVGVGYTVNYRADVLNNNILTANSAKLATAQAPGVYFTINLFVNNNNISRSIDTINSPIIARTQEFLYPGAGSSSKRPMGVYTGYQFFDTTLNKPIYWDGNNWVDSAGTSV